MFSDILEIGKIFGVEDRAEALVASQQKQLDAVLTGNGLGRTALWYSSGSDTPYVGGGIGAPQLLMETVGLTNIAADVDATWAPFNWEAVVDADPNFIILIDAEWNTADYKIGLLKANPATAQLTAVRNDNCIILPFAASESRGAQRRGGRIALAPAHRAVGTVVVPRRAAFRRPAVWGVLLGIAVLVSITVAVTIGPADIRFDEVWASVFAHVGFGDSPLTPLRDGIVWELRLPRVLTAAAVGAGLALCGAVMQAITRNPLADPYLLGLSSGASLGAVSVLLLGFAVLLPVAAFAGSLAALAATLLLASALGSITPTRAVLAGLAVSALASAITSLVIFWTVTGDSYREILGWLLGSLAGARWPAVAIAGIALLVAGIPIMLAGRRLDAFAFGDTTAASLGVPVAATRWGLLAATALLTGALVSVSGSIGFVGLVLPTPCGCSWVLGTACCSPHRARRRGVPDLG